MTAPRHTVYCHGIGLAAPGLGNWSAAGPVLRGEQAYTGGEMPPLKSGLLSPRLRRRVPALARLCLEVGAQAVTDSGIPATSINSVFSSADNDLDTLDRICSSVANDPLGVSPTLFHNSVHNTPAGYWSIATGSTAPSTSVSARDHSFAAGLLEAWTQVLARQVPVLLVVYDQPGGGPAFAPHRPTLAPFACALLLSPSPDGPRLARLSVAPGAGEEETPIADPRLETLRIANPAARTLPLLAAVAALQASRAEQHIQLTTQTSGKLGVRVW